MNNYETIEKVGQAVQTGDAGEIFDSLKGLIDQKKITEEQFAPNVLNRHGNTRDTVADFEENKAPLIYPNNLFENGNTAYILFYMKDSAEAANSGMSAIDKFAGSNSPPKGRIALYMPPAVKVNYGAKWEEAELKIEMGTSIGKDLYNRRFAGLGQLAAKGADTLLGGSEVSNEASFKTKQILDPKNALLFKGVNFRRFQFDFQLMARNAAEAETIRKIIKSFKYAMHPGGTAGGESVWNWPFFFEIYLCTPTRDYMFNIMNSALEEMDVDYGGSGVASFFRENGAPVDIRLSLQFKELFVLTKELILKDY
jgi:hypothetical protein